MEVLDGSINIAVADSKPPRITRLETQVRDPSSHAISLQVTKLLLILRICFGNLIVNRRFQKMKQSNDDSVRRDWPNLHRQTQVF